MSEKVIIYTDGACSGNPGRGGWGALLLYGDRNLELYGGEMETTNNRMELMAVIKALGVLKRRCDIEIWVDSQYVKNGITEWIFNWKKNGWRNAGKKPVKNQDLWMLLDEVVAKHSVSWNWVRGHNGHIHNERVDELARKGIMEL